MSTDINVRRIVRERVVTRLDTLEKEVAEARKQLARIEQKLDLLFQREDEAAGG